MPLEEMIDDKEWLYRSFPVPDSRQNGVIHYEIIDDKLRLSRGAWNDTACKPSVDRKALLSSPVEAKFNESDAVVQIQAKEIRTISGTLPSSEGVNRIHDVICDPTVDRPAHALIITTPPFADKPNTEKTKWKTFQRLLSLAAEKHGWIIEP